MPDCTGLAVDPCTTLWGFDSAHFTDERLGFRIEPTSAATHHVHVPAAALDDVQRRHAARAALEQALARVAGTR